MKTVQVACDRPYMQGDTLFIPNDVTRPDGLFKQRWSGNILSATLYYVELVVWKDDTDPEDIGWFTSWVFFIDGKETLWEDLSQDDKCAVIKDRLPYIPHPRSVFPWSIEEEALVILGTL